MWERMRVLQGGTPKSVELGGVYCVLAVNISKITDLINEFRAVQLCIRAHAWIRVCVLSTPMPLVYGGWV